MHFYRTTNTASDAGPHFDETLEQAKQTATAYAGTDQRHLIRVELVDVDTDKHTLCIILNDGEYDAKLLRTWRLTPRGALAEIENGD